MPTWWHIGASLATMLNPTNDRVYTPSVILVSCRIPRSMLVWSIPCDTNSRPPLWPFQMLNNPKRTTSSCLSDLPPLFSTPVAIPVIHHIPYQWTGVFDLHSTQPLSLFACPYPIRPRRVHPPSGAFLFLFLSSNSWSSHPGLGKSGETNKPAKVDQRRGSPWVIRTVPSIQFLMPFSKNKLHNPYW